MASISKPLFISLLFHGFVFAEEFSGPVIHIKDGDTIVVRRDGHPLWLRLNGIDCPEQGQAKGELARKFVSDQCYQKIVKVKTYGKDRYQRMIADIYLQNGESLNLRLVRAGYCHWNRNYAPKQK